MTYRKVDPKKVYELRDKGWSYAQIAKELSCSRQWVITLCHDRDKIEKKESVKETAQPAKIFQETESSFSKYCPICGVGFTLTQWDIDGVQYYHCENCDRWFIDEE